MGDDGLPGPDRHPAVKGEPTAWFVKFLNIPRNERIFSAWLDRWSSEVYFHLQLYPRRVWPGRLVRSVVKIIDLSPFTPAPL